MCQTKLSLPRLYVILKARELYNMPSSFVLFLQNLSSRCHEGDGACTSDDGSASRWALIRAVAALPSVLKPLSRFAHLEVGDEVTSQFELLFTDVASSMGER